MKKLYFGLVLLSIALSQSVRQEPVHTADRQAFLAAVKGLALRDSSFLVSDSLICVAGSFDTISFGELLYVVDSALSAHGYKIFLDCSPPKSLEVWRWAYQNIDPKISPPANLEAVPRYCLVMLDDGQSRSLWLQDWLGVNFWRWFCADTIHSLVAAELLVAELGRRVPLADLSAIEPETFEYMVSLAQAPHDSATLRQLLRMQADGWRLVLAYGDYGGLGMVREFSLEPRRLAEMGKLKFSRFARLSFLRAVDSLRDLKYLYEPLETTDEYDNYVCRNQLSGLLGTSEEVKYYVPLPLAALGPSISLSFDLGWLGYEQDLSNIFICQSVPEIVLPESCPYRLYGTNDVRARLDVQMVREFLLGMADMESMFGYGPGEVVKNVYITRDTLINAGFVYADKHSVYVHVKTLNVQADDGAIMINHRLVGRHEAVHAIAHRLKLEEHKIVQAIYEESAPKPGWFYRMAISDSFCWQLDEARFDPDVVIFGGHSHDSPTEYLASYFNSVVRDGWEDIMGRKSDAFRLQYTKVTQVIKNIFSYEPTLMHTPMRELLEARFNWLRTRD